MTLIIIFCLWALMAFLPMWLFKYKEIHYQSFWWDTWDGLKYSSASFCKFKRLPFYFIIHDKKYRHPKEHKDYKAFLKICEQIKNKQTPY